MGGPPTSLHSLPLRTLGLKCVADGRVRPVGPKMRYVVGEGQQGPFAPARESGERCKFSQRGPGRSLGD